MSKARGANYFLYARKSTESVDRQVQSIDDQIAIMQKVAAEYEINVVEVLTERQSAKAPGIRPEFARMIAAIKNGEADGILCWNINRLARNPVDAGEIQWLLQEGTIKEILTADRTYLPEDNALILSVEGAMATQFIKELKKTVMRGMQSKVSKGGLPGKAPHGYMNDRNTKSVVPDPERFEQVRHMWHMLLSEKYSVPTILKEVTDRGFITRKTAHCGGAPLSMSTLCSMFRNRFYMGEVNWNGQNAQGSHAPMVTPEEFAMAQEIMNGKKPHAVVRRELPFKGILRCGDCGYMITGEVKNKKIVSENGIIRTYVYYHCTRKSKTHTCKEAPISEDDLARQLGKVVSTITIRDDFLEWAQTKVTLEWTTRFEEQQVAIAEMEANVKRLRTEQEGLVDLRVRELINDETFMRKKKEYDVSIAEVELRLQKKRSSMSRVQEDLLGCLNFARKAKEVFDMGSLEDKKKMLRGLGQNYVLKDGKISLDLHPWFEPLKRLNIISQINNERLEPSADCIKTDVNASSVDQTSVWSG